LHLPQFALTCENFSRFAVSLQQGDNLTAVSKARFGVLCNMSHGLRVSDDMKRAQVCFRARNRSIWKQGRRIPPDGTEPPPGRREGPLLSPEPEQETDIAVRIAEECMQELAAAAVARRSVAIMQSMTDAAKRHQDVLGRVTATVERTVEQHDCLWQDSDRRHRVYKSLLHDVQEQTHSLLTVQHDTGAGVGTAAVEVLPMLPDMSSLNASQAAVVRVAVDFMTNGSNDAPAPLLLLHGGPGSGKTHVIRFIVRTAELLGVGIVCGAFAASAAANMSGGETLHSLCGLSVALQRKSNKASTSTDRRLRELQLRFQRVRILVIDEVSMVDAAFLGAISERLKAAMSCRQPFGGLCVLASGDFFQLPPVSGTSLPTALINPRDVPDHAEEFSGGNLFRLFRLFPFEQQERAHGSWAGTIAVLRASHGIPDLVVQQIKPLSTDDIQRDPLWQFAPVAVSGNRERAEINFLQAQRFAALNNTVVYAWKKPVFAAPGTVPLTDDDTVALSAADSRLTEAFVVGAPCTLTTNLSTIATRKGVCNGSIGRMHSLCFDSEEDEIEVFRVMARASQVPPGEIVWLPCLPSAVNISLDIIADRPRWASIETLVAGSRVIPVPRGGVEKFDAKLPSGCSRSLRVKELPVELLFAVTFHKLQGKTLDRVVVDLHNYKSPPHLCFEAVYVALTRVRSHDHVRCLPLPPGAVLSHLTALKPHKDTETWLTGFDESGSWRAPGDPEAVSHRQQMPTDSRTRKRTTHPTAAASREKRGQGQAPAVVPSDRGSSARPRKRATHPTTAESAEKRVA